MNIVEKGKNDNIFESELFLKISANILSRIKTDT